MAQQKRNFDMTRDIWEQRSAGATIVPSPSKRFASPKNSVYSRERRSVEPENYDASASNLVNEDQEIKDHRAQLKQAFFESDAEENHDTTKYFTPVMTYETQTVVSKTVTVEYVNSKSAITSDDESEGDSDTLPIPQRPRSRGANSFSKLGEQRAHENRHEKHPSNGSLLETDRRSSSSLEKSSSGFSLSRLFKSTEKLRALFSTESPLEMASTSTGSPLNEVEYSSGNPMLQHGNTVYSTPSSASYVKGSVVDDNVEEGFPLPTLEFEEKNTVSKSLTSGKISNSSIQELEKEAEKQLMLYTKIRNRIQATTSASPVSMVVPRADAERELLLSARKRKGCLLRIEKLKAADSQDFRRASNAPKLMMCNATVSCSSISLSVNSEFWDGLRQDRIRATECLQLDEVTPDGSLKITNFFQFFNLTSDFSVEVEAQIIRIQKLDAGEDAKKHTPSLLKKFMAVMPKSAGKSESSSCSSNCPMSSSMSLGSTHLTLRNFKEKTFSMSGGLIVQSYDVVLKISANLELEFLAKHEGFLTFHCYTDVGTDWVRRWCKLEGTALSFWKYPDDAERNVRRLGAYSLEKCSDTLLFKAKGGLNRPNSFVLHSWTPIFSKIGDRNTEADFEYSVMADTKEDLEGWLHILNAVLEGINDWRSAQ